MSGFFNVEVPPNETRMVGLPPCHQTGSVPFESVFLSLASTPHLGGATVRLAIGRPEAWRIEENLVVGAGRANVFELREGDEVASVVHGGGEPVSVLVEYSHIYAERAAAAARMVNASHVVARRSETTVVGLPPVNRAGAVQFPTGFLSLATDFEEARVRLAIGHRLRRILRVPIGRRIVREIREGDDVASLDHQAGREVGILLEYTTSASWDN